MSALLTKAFEKWVAECTASNLPARPDAIIFALMGREPTREDNAVPEEKITYAVNELTCGQLDQNNIVCSAVVPDDCAFSYDWICLIHQTSRTLCGVIKTPVRQKHAGESLIRNFTITYQGMAQAAQITIPPRSWQVDIYPEVRTMLKTPNHLSEIATEGREAQQESRDNLGLKSAATMEPQSDTHDRTAGRLAVPGMFGFGKIFSAKDCVYFHSAAEFLPWIKDALPGRYAVNDNLNKDIIPDVVFTGVVDVIQTNPGKDDIKSIIFYGINGDVYVNRYLSPNRLMGWESLKNTPSSIIELLTGTAGSTPTTPGHGLQVGSLVMAGYKGVSDGDSRRQLRRGERYSGSRLMWIEFKCDGIIPNGGNQQSSDISVYADAAFSGSYIALTGGQLATAGSDSIIIGLFIRDW